MSIKQLPRHPFFDDQGEINPIWVRWLAALYTELKSHAASHIQGGASEIDGDQIDIDLTPDNYAPATDPGEVSDADHLSAHLAGIDDALGKEQISRKWFIADEEAVTIDNYEYTVWHQELKIDGTLQVNEYGRAYIDG